MLEKIAHFKFEIFHLCAITFYADYTGICNDTTHILLKPDWAIAVQSKKNVQLL